MAHKQPILSVLIPAIYERLNTVKPLIAKLEAQSANLPDGKLVEILMFADNCKRSVGYKRDALVKIANGQYVSFVDDDDDVFDGYLLDIVLAITNNDYPDLVAFNSLCTLNGKSLTVHTDLGNPNEEVTKDQFDKWNDVKRQPFHVCAWKAEIAKSEHFPDQNNAEDWAWCEKIIPKVKTYHKIEKTLHHYIYDSDVTRVVV
ncbi:MAG: hypothetical protein KAI81_07760 [Candidatus Marinimicrobia bacterium]|nr:hypothetical protein [Candidatus Neomarinimicrobiota bacterium]